MSQQKDSMVLFGRARETNMLDEQDRESVCSASLRENHIMSEIS